MEDKIYIMMIGSPNILFNNYECMVKILFKEPTKKDKIKFLNEVKEKYGSETKQFICIEDNKLDINDVGFIELNKNDIIPLSALEMVYKDFLSKESKKHIEPVIQKEGIFNKIVEFIKNKI